MSAEWPALGGRQEGTAPGSQLLLRWRLGLARHSPALQEVWHRGAAHGGGTGQAARLQRRPDPQVPDGRRPARQGSHPHRRLQLHRVQAGRRLVCLLQQGQEDLQGAGNAGGRDEVVADGDDGEDTHDAVHALGVQGQPGRSQDVGRREHLEEEARARYDDGQGIFQVLGARAVHDGLPDARVLPLPRRIVHGAAGARPGQADATLPRVEDALRRHDLAVPLPTLRPR
mmetsp:Transcript_21818/g.55693  ORF Transcript_21818/g.55693 Transcript_21818/m.55693 type:complete len:228 (+) Transcript_21818:115-798(+)